MGVGKGDAEANSPLLYTRTASLATKYVLRTSGFLESFRQFARSASALDDFQFRFNADMDFLHVAVRLIHQPAGIRKVREIKTPELTQLTEGLRLLRHFLTEKLIFEFGFARMLVFQPANHSLTQP